MEYRRMGSSELTVSAIGFGCWELGGTNYGPIDEAAAVAAIDREGAALGGGGVSGSAQAAALPVSG
ncbi:MAG TPA: hypothetical protein VFX49_17425 [Chloroflexota bacterium]|nr:hypothetical protein [Chloroflexota bacterium]